MTKKIFVVVSGAEKNVYKSGNDAPDTYTQPHQTTLQKGRKIQRQSERETERERQRQSHTERQAGKQAGRQRRKQRKRERRIREIEL